jgi:hypothetical protein
MSQGSRIPLDSSKGVLRQSQVYRDGDGTTALPKYGAQTSRLNGATAGVGGGTGSKRFIIELAPWRVEEAIPRLQLANRTVIGQLTDEDDQSKLHASVFRLRASPLIQTELVGTTTDGLVDESACSLAMLGTCEQLRYTITSC